MAASAALAGLESAVMNVFINLSSIKDEDYVYDMETQMETLHEEGAILKAGVLRVVPGHLGD